MKSSKTIDNIEEINELIQKCLNEYTLTHFVYRHVSYLLEEKTILEKCVQAEASQDKNRIEVAKDELGKDEGLDYNAYAHILLLIKTSSKYPLTKEEMQALDNLFDLCPPTVDVLWGVGFDDNLEDQLSLVLVLSNSV